MKDIVRTPAEAALYLIAVRYPEAFAEAEREARDFPCPMLAEDQDALGRAKAILGSDRRRAALDYLADRANWSGDPHDQDSTLHGHDTPYELAARAVANP